MILQSKVPSRKRRKKNEAAHRLQRPKEKEEDEVERRHGLQGQIPASRTKVLEVEALQVRLSGYAAKNGKPAEPASKEKSANFGTPQLANFLSEEAAERGTPVLTLTDKEELTRPKQTSLPLNLP